MPILHLILLAIIQGVTEFLPISSSAHLILFPSLTGANDQGPLIDVSVHLGTLIAVMIYFREDTRRIYKGAFGVVMGKVKTSDDFLALCLLIATVPAILFGLTLKTLGFDLLLRESVGLIGMTMFGFGIVLWWADRKGPVHREMQSWTMKEAVILGLWQALALIPGTSRSGITITGARLLGYGRSEAARISMLMSIPVILAASTLGMFDALRLANFAGLRDGAIAGLFAAISAYIALSIMMYFVKSVNFTPYVIYRVLFGALLIWWAYA